MPIGLLKSLNGGAKISDIQKAIVMAKTRSPNDDVRWVLELTTEYVACPLYFAVCKQVLPYAFSTEEIPKILNSLGAGGLRSSIQRLGHLNLAF